jgi:FixJ family two-component response regulator
LYERKLQAKMTQTSPEIGAPLVVVVDDDSAVCNSLKFALELEGFKVLTYGSGAELLRAGTLVPPIAL